MNNYIKISIPKCENDILTLQWEDNFSIKCETDNSNSVVITANSSGLVSLARHLLTLAQQNVPINTHIHFDESNSLEDGSINLTIVKSQE